MRTAVSAMRGSGRLALTETKAIPAPNRDDMEATRNPGHIPYVNPIRVIDGMKPNNGGWEASAVTCQAITSGSLVV